MNIMYQYLWTPIAVFTVGYILLRIMGKRAVSEMSSFDLLITIVLGTAISEPVVTKNLNLASYYSLAIGIVYLIFIRLTLTKSFKKFFTSSPTVLIRGGDIDEKALRKSKMTVQQLLGQLRAHGFSQVQDVEMATMEETGQISMLPKATSRPIQPNDLEIKPNPTYIPIPLIIDGEIIHHNLTYLKKDEKWLRTRLMKYEDFSNITLATYSANGTVQVDSKKVNNHDKGIYSYKPGDNN